jgi:hypothetical protein
MWRLLRLVLVAANSAVSLVNYPQFAHISWQTAVSSGVLWLSLVLGVLSAAALFGWLSASQFRPDTIWSQTFEWSVPFLPMGKYPLRYWAFVSFSLIASGAIALLASVLHRKSFAMGAIFFTWGACILVVVLLLRKHSEKFNHG